LNPLGLSRPVMGLLYIYAVCLFRPLSLINRKVFGITRRKTKKDFVT